MKQAANSNVARTKVMMRVERFIRENLQTKNKIGECALKNAHIHPWYSLLYTKKSWRQQKINIFSINYKIQMLYLCILTIIWQTLWSCRGVCAMKHKI